MPISITFSATDIIRALCIVQKMNNQQYWIHAGSRRTAQHCIALTATWLGPFLPITTAAAGRPSACAQGHTKSCQHRQWKVHWKQRRYMCAGSAEGAGGLGPLGRSLLQRAVVFVVAGAGPSTSSSKSRQLEMSSKVQGAASFPTVLPQHHCRPSCKPQKQTAAAQTQLWGVEGRWELIVFYSHSEPSCSSSRQPQ